MDRNRSLDGARGLAALSVALAHCATTVGGVAIYASTVRDFGSMSAGEIVLRLWHSAFNGDAAVMLFFALSGFVLGRSLERESAPPTLALDPYLIKRAFRLLPATIFAGAFAFALEPITIQQMIGAMFIYDNSANGVLWSLQVEVIGSILIFILWASRSRVLIAGLLIFYVYLYLRVPSFVGVVRSEFTMFPVVFILGYVVPSVPKKVWDSKVIFALGLTMLLLSDLFLGRTWHTRDGQVIGAFLVVGFLQANPIRFLNARPAQFLGDVSYSFYLLHPLLLEEGVRLLNHIHLEEPLPVRAAMLALVTIPVALALAHLVSIWIEKPGIQIGKLVVRRLREMPPTSTV
ncbi:MAG TPA: acyltransferase [Paraburkholderia sp.]